MNRARDGRGAEREVLDAMAFPSGPIFRPSNPGGDLIIYAQGSLIRARMAASAMADMKVVRSDHSRVADCDISKRAPLPDGTQSAKRVAKGDRKKALRLCN
jgi:hypothetical protein